MAVPIIQARKLGLRLGSFDVLEDLSFTIPGGAFCAILGPNGGGKSTLLKLILGLYSPSAGELQVLDAAAGQRGGALGYVPQVKTLDRRFPAIALDLVVSGILQAWPWQVGLAQQQQAEAALEQAGASQLARRQLAVLSGGELQRVYLARALVRRPRLLLLDEPASGIDAAGEHDMYHVLETYQRESGATVLMVTHDWGAAWHHADLALVLNRSLLACGQPVDVLSDETMRRAFGHSGHSHGMGWGDRPGPGPDAEDQAAVTQGRGSRVKGQGEMQYPSSEGVVNPSPGLGGDATEEPRNE